MLNLNGISIQSTSPDREHRRARGWPSFARRVMVLLVAFPLLAVAIFFGVLRASAPPPAPPDIVPGAPLTACLAEHVLLVIVDGFLYDVATDRVRMPLFAQAMRSHSHGLMLAGPVSMTSSAVMAIGTGQRGQLEQVIRNLHSEPPRQNSWLANANAAGLRMMAVGDPAWRQLYSQWLARNYSDPEGVAIDVDFNPITFENVRKLHREQPDFLVAHFVTPDHQGHAYGIQSSRYARHIHDFDQQLAALLAEFDASWTVIVTSDHGAADSGTHGTDVAVQRRCPVYVYGPGFLDRGALDRELDQLELSVTLPLLLGVAPPAHGTGRPTLEWLDLSEELKADIACENARRVVAYSERAGTGSHLGSDWRAVCSSRASASARLQSAERAVTTADSSFTTIVGLSSGDVRLWLAAIVLLGCLVSALLLPKHSWSTFILGVGLLAMTVALVAGVERLPGIWPNVVRATLFVAGNSVLLALLLVPRRALQLLGRCYPYSGLLPVALAISYPANTRPQCIVTLLVVAIVFWRRDRTRTRGRGGAWDRPTLIDLAWFGVSMAALIPVVLRENATYSSLFSGDLLHGVVASAGVLAFTAWLVRRFESNGLFGLALPLVMVLPIWMRPLVGPWLGYGAWLLGLLVLIWALVEKRPVWALLGGVFSVLWVARDIESIALVATVSAAWVYGKNLAGRHLGHADFVVTMLFGFSLMFALRIGLQDGLEFGGMDWGAAGFNNPSVSPAVVGTALVYKYVMGAFLIAYALLSRLSRHVELRMLAGLALCMVLRALALSAMFFIAGNSYWTALRILGDLPTALAMAFGSTLLLGIRALATMRPLEAVPTTGLAASR